MTTKPPATTPDTTEPPPPLSSTIAVTVEPRPATSQHGTPPDGLCCLCTMEDITLEDGNYVEYQCYPSLTWKSALYEQSVVEQLLKEQFHQFVERVKTTDCQAELKRLLHKGPPVYVSDPHAFPLDDGDTTDTTTTASDTHVVQLWFASDNVERVAKLDGAVEGTERDALWEELKQFIIVEGKEKGDDDDQSTAKTN